MKQYNNYIINSVEIDTCEKICNALIYFNNATETFSHVYKPISNQFIREAVNLAGAFSNFENADYVSDGVYGSRPQDPHTQKNRRYHDRWVTSSAVPSSAMPSSARKRSTQNMIQKPGEPGALIGHALIGHALIGQEKVYSEYDPESRRTGCPHRPCSHRPCPHRPCSHRPCPHRPGKDLSRI
ncbi:unnamed protein product [Cuscuta europaea]|uniref:Uncharacterized protein n=1 Tax=Cuscuta europaea TaxID=41803 RepID=A0A9P1EG73_CUSEU|nr:unnamed protein product [Cuscuta europaea]